MIPVSESIHSYVLTVSGTSTLKNPPAVHPFAVNAAPMSVGTITVFKPIYQRTEMMRFSFQPIYPDGSLPSTGVALLTLASPSGTRVTLTATYDSIAQTFNASNTTSIVNKTALWTVTLGTRACSDAYGNA